ncbi:unnamed protein product, partial [Rotaria sordida]
KCTLNDIRTNSYYFLFQIKQTSSLIRFIWEFSYSVPPCELSHMDQRPAAVKFHFLYFAILLFVLTCLITITISLLTRPIPDQCVC